METLIPSRDTHREMKTGDFAEAEIWQHDKRQANTLTYLTLGDNFF